MSVARNGAAVAGVVLTAPTLPRAAPAVVRRTVGAAASMVPARSIPVRPRPLAELARTPGHAERAASDPEFVRGNIPWLLAATALDQAADLWPRLPAWRVPTLVVHGTADTFTDPRASHDLIDGLGSTDRDLHTVPGGCHELLADLDQDATLHTIMSWLKAH